VEDGGLRKGHTREGVKAEKEVDGDLNARKVFEVRADNANRQGFDGYEKLGRWPAAKQFAARRLPASSAARAVTIKPSHGERDDALPPRSAPNRKRADHAFGKPEAEAAAACCCPDRAKWWRELERQIVRRLPERCSGL